MATPVPATPSSAIRVEDETSVGRSYSGASQRRSVPGLGALRAAKRERSLRAPPGGPVLESMTMARVHLARATREEVLDYFRNTWALTETLFSSLASDAVFYMVPDSLRRPLIFYFGHPAALYINKGHQAGLVDQVNPYFQKLFETGVDEMSWDDMDAMQVRASWAAASGGRRRAGARPFRSPQRALTASPRLASSCLASRRPSRAGRTPTSRGPR